MRQYHDALETVLQHGEDVYDRTGTGTISHFGQQMRFFLQDGFPAITTKKLAWKAVVGELIWFLEGSTDERRLAELTYGKDRADLIGKRTIWTDNADAQGKELGYRNDDLYKGLGPVYGGQWRNFNGDSFGEGVDQIKWLINEIRTNPDSRRLILSAWNPNQLQQQALPPCHCFAQFRVYNGRLSCQMYQRSADMFLGVPFNIASYSLLTHIIARECNLEVGEFVHSIGDAHIYKNHINQVYEQLSREHFKQPDLVIAEDFDLMKGLDGKFPLDSASKFTLNNYAHHPSIKAPMAV
jgi:thymidylate synthase